MDQEFAKLLPENRLDRIKYSKKANWTEIPADLLPTMEEVRMRIKTWKIKQRNKKHLEQTKWVHPDGISMELYLDLIGELRSAESRKRLNILEHDINKLRETRCKYLISLQPNAIQAIRLKKLLEAQPEEQMKPIPRLFTKVERQRIAEILHYDFEVIFGRQT